VVLDRGLAEHRHQPPHGVLPHLTLVAESAPERVQLGRCSGFTHTQFDAPVAQQIERRDPLGDPRRVVGGKLDHPVAEPDALRPLARSAEEDLGCRRMGVLLEEVVLDFPREVEAQAVGQLDLVEGLLQQFVLALRVPGTRQLVLVEDPELHPREQYPKYPAARRVLPGALTIRHGYVPDPQ